MILFGLKQCDTCRKALKVLDDVAFVDVRKDRVPDAVLIRALEVFGDALVNRRSTTWRNLTVQQRESDPFALLKENPALMKRPLIDVDGQLFLGWGKDIQADLLGRNEREPICNVTSGIVGDIDA